MGLLALLGVYMGNIQAQYNVSINLPQANIQSGADFKQTSSVGDYSYLLIALIPSIYAMSTQGNFSSSTSTHTVPLSVAYLKLNQIGGVNLLSSVTEAQLSSSSTLLVSSLLGITLSKGAILMDFRVATASHTWLAGSYKTGLRLTAQGILGGTITPQDRDVSITVPAFIAAPATINTTSLLVNDLNYFRAPAGISSNKIVSISTTVPYIPTLRTSSSQFTFSTTLPYNNPPVSPVSDVAVSLSGVSTATAIASLSTTDQALTTSSGIAVSSNNQTLTNTFSVSGSKLKSDFVQAGTYRVPLVYSWNGLPANPVQASGNGTLEIVVSDLGELVANQQAVDLAFSTADHYKNGVSKDMPAHLKLSKTTPYNLYVRATSENFSSGTNTIPLNVMRIGPMAGETGINTITLSTTAQQLIQSANPVIDRNLNIQYRIPANETHQLLNKPAGNYSTSIIFSFVAP